MGFRIRMWGFELCGGEYFGVFFGGFGVFGWGLVSRFDGLLFFYVRCLRREIDMCVYACYMYVRMCTYVNACRGVFWWGVIFVV